MKPTVGWRKRSRSRLRRPPCTCSQRRQRGGRRRHCSGSSLRCGAHSPLRAHSLLHPIRELLSLLARQTRDAVLSSAAPQLQAAPRSLQHGNAIKAAAASVQAARGTCSRAAGRRRRRQRCRRGRRRHRPACGRAPGAAAASQGAAAQGQDRQPPRGLCFCDRSSRPLVSATVRDGCKGAFAPPMCTCAAPARPAPTPASTAPLLRRWRFEQAAPLADLKLRDAGLAALDDRAAADGSRSAEATFTAQLPTGVWMLVVNGHASASALPLRCARVCVVLGWRRSCAADAGSSVSPVCSTASPRPPANNRCEFCSEPYEVAVAAPFDAVLYLNSPPGDVTSSGGLAANEIVWEADALLCDLTALVVDALLAQVLRLPAVQCGDAGRSRLRRRTTRTAVMPPTMPRPATLHRRSCPPCACAAGAPASSTPARRWPGRRRRPQRPQQQPPRLPSCWPAAAGSSRRRPSGGGRSSRSGVAASACPHVIPPSRVLAVASIASLELMQRECSVELGISAERTLGSGQRAAAARTGFKRRALGPHRASGALQPRTLGSQLCAQKL